MHYHLTNTSLLQSRGFSLMELIIALAIIGIAAAIALPSYQHSAKKANRSDGEAMLMEIRSRMEVIQYANGTYTTDLTDLDYDVASNIPSEEGFYKVSVLTPTSDCPIKTCYVLRAIPKDRQSKDGFLELTSTGVKRRDKNGNGNATDIGEESWR
jgi:type IV pilus assembly protein PilE